MGTLKVNGNVLVTSPAMTMVSGLMPLQDGSAALFANGLAITNPATQYDQGWLRMTGTGESDSILELATGDDGNEPIVVRQYNTSSAIVHQITLLDANGNTETAGSITASSFKGNADTASKWATARTLSLTNTVTGDVSFDGSGNATLSATIRFVGIDPNTFASNFRGMVKGDTSYNQFLATIRSETGYSGQLSAYGSGLGWGTHDTHGYIYVDYSSPNVYIGGGNGNKLNWTRNIAFTDSTVAGANYASSAGNADTIDGHHFHWNGQGGQPTWLWGANEYGNSYVYNPSNFNVNYANSSGYASSAGNADTVDGWHADGFLQKLGWWHSSNSHSVDNLTSGIVFAYTNHGAPSSWGHTIAFTGGSNNSYVCQLHATGTNRLFMRNKSSDYGQHGWIEFLTESNYSWWCLPLSGGTMSGNLAINTHGNTMTIGSLNSAWCHFQSSADIPFYFNRRVFVDGCLGIYQMNSQGCGSSLPSSPTIGQIFFKI